MESKANILMHIKEALVPFRSKALTDQESGEIVRHMRWLRERGEQVGRTIETDVWTWEKLTSEEKGAYSRLYDELHPLNPDAGIDASWLPKLQNLEDLFLMAVDPTRVPRYGFVL